MFSLIRSTIFVCKNTAWARKFTEMKERIWHGCYRMGSLIIFQSAAYIETAHSDGHRVYKLLSTFMPTMMNTLLIWNRFIVVAAGWCWAELNGNSCTFRTKETSRRRREIAHAYRLIVFMNPNKWSALHWLGSMILHGTGRVFFFISIDHAHAHIRYQMFGQEGFMP